MDLRGSRSVSPTIDYSFAEAQIRAIISVLRERARRDFFERHKQHYPSHIRLKTGDRYQ
jgi:hypothetical protein